MATGLPARWVILCALCAAGAARVQAQVVVEKRPVAVIDLVGDPQTSELRARIYSELRLHWALVGIANMQLEPVLVGPLVDENEPFITAARAKLAAAEDALAQFDSAAAVTAAKEGQQLLTQAAPTPAALALYADLAFALGNAQFNDRHLAEAKSAFALANRLDPDRKLDPGRYLPELRSLYEAAKTAEPGTTKLEVRGMGRVVIDGVDVGAAPGTFDVAAGHHLVQLVGPERHTAGVVLTGGHMVVIPDARLDDREKLQRARLVLARSPDVTARASAMRQLAQLVGVHDAVLITKDGDRVMVQTWREPEQGFSAIRPYHGEKPGELMRALAPPEPPQIEKPRPIEFPKKPIVVEKAWWEKTWVRGSIATAVVGGIVGAIVWSRRTGNVDINPQVQPE